MTIRLYAGRKGWPLGAVTVELSHQRVYADDCEECEEESGGYLDFIHRRIVLSGPLTEEQRQRLEVIAQRCPVHKTLMARPRITDEVEAVEG